MDIFISVILTSFFWFLILLLKHKNISDMNREHIVALEKIRKEWESNFHHLRCKMAFYRSLNELSAFDSLAMLNLLHKAEKLKDYNNFQCTNSAEIDHLIYELSNCTNFSSALYDAEDYTAEKIVEELYILCMKYENIHQTGLFKSDEHSRGENNGYYDLCERLGYRNSYTPNSLSYMYFYDVHIKKQIEMHFDIIERAYDEIFKIIKSGNIKFNPAPLNFVDGKIVFQKILGAVTSEFRFEIFDHHDSKKYIMTFEQLYRQDGFDNLSIRKNIYFVTDEKKEVHVDRFYGEFYPRKFDDYEKDFKEIL